MHHPHNLTPYTEQSSPVIETVTANCQLSAVTQTGTSGILLDQSYWTTIDGYACMVSTHYVDFKNSPFDPTLAEAEHEWSGTKREKACDVQHELNVGKLICEKLAVQYPHLFTYFTKIPGCSPVDLAFFQTDASGTVVSKWFVEVKNKMNAHSMDGSHTAGPMFDDPKVFSLVQIGQIQKVPTLIHWTYSDTFGYVRLHDGVEPNYPLLQKTAKTVRSFKRKDRPYANPVPVRCFGWEFVDRIWMFDDETRAALTAHTNNLNVS